MSPNLPGSVLDPSLDALSWDERCNLGTTHYTSDEMLRKYTNHHENEDENGSVTVNDRGLEDQAGLCVPHRPNNMMSTPTPALEHASSQYIVNDLSQGLAPASALTNMQVLERWSQLPPGESTYPELSYSEALHWDEPEAPFTNHITQSNMMGQSNSVGGHSVSASPYSRPLERVRTNSYNDEGYRSASSHPSSLKRVRTDSHMGSGDNSDRSASQYPPPPKRARGSSNTGRNDNGDMFATSSPQPRPAHQRHKLAQTMTPDEDFEEDSDDLVVLGSSSAKGKGSSAKGKGSSAKGKRSTKQPNPRQADWIRKIIADNFKAKYLDPTHHVEFFTKPNPKDWIGREEGYQKECERIEGRENSAQKALRAKARREGKQACEEEEEM